MRLVELIEDEEGRDPYLGRAFWVDSSGHVDEVHGEHHEYVADVLGPALDLTPDEIHGGDANYHVIRHGWCRCITHDAGDSVFIAAKSMRHARNAFHALIEAGVSSADPQTLSVDIYGSNPHAIVSKRVDPERF